MFINAVGQVASEVAAIKSINSQVFEKSSQNIDLYFRDLLVNEKYLWSAFLCILSAKALREVNKTTVKLGCIMHLLSITMHLHKKLPQTILTTDIKKKLQYPILIGDLMYCKIFSELSRFEMQQYIPAVSSLICTIHERLAGQESQEEEIEALICEKACYFGAHSVIGSTDTTEKISELGYHLGALRTLWESEEGYSAKVNSRWQSTWKLLDFLPGLKEKSLFQDILLKMGEQWTQKEQLC